MSHHVFGAFYLATTQVPSEPPEGVLTIRINNYGEHNYDHVIFGWPVEVAVTLGAGTVVNENEGRPIVEYPSFTMPEKVAEFVAAYGVEPRLYAYVDGGPEQTDPIRE